jgi:hypothetical protein
MNHPPISSRLSVESGSVNHPSSRQIPAKCQEAVGFPTYAPTRPTKISKDGKVIPKLRFSDHTLDGAISSSNRDELIDSFGEQLDPAAAHAAEMWSEDLSPEDNAAIADLILDAQEAAANAALDAQDFWDYYETPHEYR